MTWATYSNLGQRDSLLKHKFGSFLAMAIGTTCEKQ